MKTKILLLIGVFIILLVFTSFIQYKDKKACLINEGYTEQAATHIAKVELGYIAEDAEYIALKED